MIPVKCPTPALYSSESLPAPPRAWDRFLRSSLCWAIRAKAQGVGGAALPPGHFLDFCVGRACWVSWGFVGFKHRVHVSVCHDES